VLVSASESDRDEFLYGKFPEGFMFGASTSAFQIEGGWNADGKGQSIYDLMTHSRPSMFKNQNADVADNSYHKYKEDVKILKAYGAKAYRFSIAWSRVLPNGTADVINQPGIDYYNNLLKELEENSIEPIVTLYHWDLPLPFYSIGGWLNESMVGYFNDYAKVCFEKFGPKVKKWITLNEPLVIMERHPFFMKGPITNQTELSILQYRTMHNLILGHATAYRTYENTFKASQKGEVSIALSSGWGEPKTKSQQDVAAADRYMDFNLGIFAHPIFVDGDYPARCERIRGK
jgi:lactase-phlorizin hydrolase